MDIHAPDTTWDPERVAKLDRLGDEIAELSAHLEAATARLLELIREFDARGGWNTGFRSCAHWLSWRVGLNLGAAREKVRVAHALGTLPLLANTLARGELSYAKVRALTRVATPETEERLLGVGRGGTAAHVERIVRGWRRVDRKAEAKESKRQHASRALHVWDDEDGTLVVRGRLTPEVGALLRRALDAARETLYQRRRPTGTPPTPPTDPSLEAPTVAQQQADALALLAETALHHELDPGAPGERYQVVVHVEAPALADPDQPGQSVLEGGTHVPAEPFMWRSPLPVPLKFREGRRPAARGARSRVGRGVVRFRRGRMAKPAKVIRLRRGEVYLVNAAAMSPSAASSATRGYSVTVPCSRVDSAHRGLGCSAWVPVVWASPVCDVILPLCAGCFPTFARFSNSSPPPLGAAGEPGSLSCCRERHAPPLDPAGPSWSQRWPACSTWR
jgi:uncharacterized protein DUF222